MYAFRAIRWILAQSYGILMLLTTRAPRRGVARKKRPMKNCPIICLMASQFLALPAEERIGELPFFTHSNLEMLAQHEEDPKVLAAIASTMENYLW